MGYYVKISFKNLLLVPDLCVQNNRLTRVSKQFKKHGFTMRASLGITIFFWLFNNLDIKSKPYEGFPKSRTGLRQALCNINEPKNVLLMVRKAFNIILICLGKILVI